MHDELTLQSQYRLMEALVTAERTARLRLDSLHEIVFETDAAGRLTFLNQTWKKALGREPGAALGEPFGTYLAPEDMVIWDQLCRTAAPNGEFSPLREIRLRHADQTWVVVDITVCRREDGGLLGALQDASSRKATEKEIRQLAMVAAHTDNGVVITDAEHKVVWVNAGFTRITDYQLEEIRGRDPGAVLQGPGTDPATVRTMHEQLAKQAAFRVEILNYRKSGEQVWLALEVQPIHDSNGGLTGFIGLESDITAAKAREHRLFQSEAKSRALLAAIPDLMFELSPAGIFENHSAAVPEDFGVPPEAFLGKTLEEVVPANIAQGVRAAIARLGPERSVETFEYEFELAQRGLRQYEARVTRSETGSYVILSRDITARKQMEQAVRESESRFRGISASAQDAIVMIDSLGEISFWNRAAEELFGYPEAEVLGRNLHRLVMPMRFWGQFSQGFANFQKTGTGTALGKSLSLTAIRRNQEEFPVELSISPLRLSDSWHAVGIIRDVSDRKRVEDELRRAKENAEAANAAKSEFLALMSHEIRTPINGVLGMLELTLDSPLNAEQHEQLLMAQSSAESLLAIIDEILDFSKIEAGKISLLHLPFSLPNVLTGAVQPLLLRARKKGVEVVVENPQDVPPSLLGDPGRLQQVLLNLVNNAIKFTECGRIRIAARVESQDQELVQLHFTVADTGIGIPAEKCQAIFQPFEQVDRSASRRHGGTGLGLAICERLVQAMAGQIWVESELGVGSEFHFTAVCGCDRNPPPAACQVPRGSRLLTEQDAVEQPKSVSSSLRILLAEDEEVSREVACRMLRKRGHRVTVATHGREALAAWENAPADFDLLLTDVMMPGMSGFELTREIRQRETALGTHLTIIALTAKAMKGDAERCREEGMDGYLSKPIVRLELDRLVEAAGGQGPPPVRVEQELPISTAVFDYQELLHACGDDTAFTAEVVALFRGVYAEALPQLHAALVQGNAAALARHAHRLKGSAASIRALALRTAAEKLELQAGHEQWAKLTNWLQRLEQEYQRLAPQLAGIV